jgi:hypothetical protein
MVGIGTSKLSLSNPVRRMEEYKHKQKKGGDKIPLLAGF